MSRHLAHPLVRFAVVGLSNTLISFLAFQALLLVFEGLLVRATLAQLGSFALGICWSFFWNRRWTFRPSSGEATPAQRPLPQFLRFVALQASLMLGSAACLGVLIDRLHQPPTLTWVLVMGVVTGLNYALSRYWAFRPSVTAVTPSAPR